LRRQGLCPTVHSASPQPLRVATVLIARVYACGWPGEPMRRAQTEAARGLTLRDLTCNRALWYQAPSHV